MKQRPGVWRQSSRSWSVSSFHFLSLYRLGVTMQILLSSFLTVVLHTEACDAISFGLEDILYTAASDSEDFRPPAASKEPVGRVSEPMHPPPYMVCRARGCSASCQRPCKRVDLKRPNEPPAMASSGRF